MEPDVALLNSREQGGENDGPWGNNINPSLNAETKNPIIQIELYRRANYVPIAIAVGFAIISSFLLRDDVGGCSAL
jgi:hypothetical protein